MATEPWAVVAMPWREEPQRVEAYKFCRQWWQYHGFDVTPHGGDPNRPFHLAEARNAAVNAALLGPVIAGTARSPQVVILADADTVGDIDAIHEAISIAVEDGYVVYPYDEYRYLDYRFIANTDEGAHKGYDEPMFPLKTFIPKWKMTDSVGGLMVINPHTYYDLGGMDEKFDRQWGFEDRAFLAVADTLANVVRIKGGRAYSFSHDDGGKLRDWSSKNPNYWRNELYQMCLNRPRLMNELIK